MPLCGRVAWAQVRPAGEEKPREERLPAGQAPKSSVSRGRSPHKLAMDLTRGWRSPRRRPPARGPPTRLRTQRGCGAGCRLHQRDAGLRMQEEEDGNGIGNCERIWKRSQVGGTRMPEGPNVPLSSTEASQGGVCPAHQVTCFTALRACDQTRCQQHTHPGKCHGRGARACWGFCDQSSAWRDDGHQIMEGCGLSAEPLDLKQQQVLGEGAT